VENERLDAGAAVKMSYRHHKSTRRILAILAVVAATVAAAEPPAVPTHPEKRETTTTESLEQQLFDKAEQAWATAWSRYFRSETSLFYDYVSSKDPTKSQAHLPTPDEVKRQFPNTCGWSTGMEDSAISAGVWLATICDRFDATGDGAMKACADKVWAGMARLDEVSKSPGFIPRSVCLADGESHYINSSRDQYTHYCHGLWRFYHSPLADEAQRAAMRTIMAAICARMERNVTARNDYSLCREDGKPGTVDKMWEVWFHERARLPMIYLIGWDLTGDKHWRELYLRYAWDAARGSVPPPAGLPAYALQQAVFSFEPLVAIEREDADLRAAWLKAMTLYADAMQPYTKQCQEYKPAVLAELQMDWRKQPTQDLGNGLCPTWPAAVLHEFKTVREPAESVLSQLMVPERPFPADQLELFQQAIAQTDYDASIAYGLFYHVAAYWRAVKRGVLTTP